MIRSFIRRSLLIPFVGLLLPAASQATPDGEHPTRLNYGGNPHQLERSWSELKEQLDSLDTLLGPAPEPEASDDLQTPELPSTLLDRQATNYLATSSEVVPNAARGDLAKKLYL